MRTNHRRLPNGRILSRKLRPLEDLTLEDNLEKLDDGAAPWLWERGWAKKLGKKVSDTKARDEWWNGASVAFRKDQRVNYLAYTQHAPKGTRKEQDKWWTDLGKDRREKLRDKYRDDSFFEKALDIITLSPILSEIPIISDIHASTMKLHKAPFNAMVKIANGENIGDSIINQFKEQLDAAKELAPYAQTIVSFIPGVGTGLSAAIGAGVALAEGRPLDQAVLAGVRGAIPGGALAQAAFDVATAAMAGKPIEEVVLNALPVDKGVKDNLIKGAKLAKDLVEGKKVDKALMDATISYLPEKAQKAVQIGVAVGSAALAQKDGKKQLEKSIEVKKKNLKKDYPKEFKKVNSKGTINIADAKKAISKIKAKLPSIGNSKKTVKKTIAKTDTGSDKLKESAAKLKDLKAKLQITEKKNTDILTAGNKKVTSLELANKELIKSKKKIAAALGIPVNYV